MLTITKRKWGLVVLGLIFMVCKSAYAATEKTDFTEIRQYVKKHYIDGTFKSVKGAIDHRPDSHDVFKNDLYKYKLLCDFRKELDAGNPEAKRMFNVILEDFHGGLCRIKEGQRQRAIVFVSIVLGGVSVSSLCLMSYPSLQKRIKAAVAFWVASQGLVYLCDAWELLYILLSLANGGPWIQDKEKIAILESNKDIWQHLSPAGQRFITSGRICCRVDGGALT